MAKTPEQLMRSRYSAYAMANADYIYQTYALVSKAQQSLDDIREWAQQCRWLQLEIHHTNVADDQISGQVEFTAIYYHQSQLLAMRELSRFITEQNKEQQQWRYLDGDIISHQPIKQPKRNQACFCGSGKKFKACCLKLIG